MNGLTIDWKDPSFWTKTTIQLIILYNTIFKKNIDPQAGAALVTTLEGIFHFGHAYVQAAQATAAVPPK